MIRIRQKHHRFLVGFALVLFLGTAYLYFSQSLSSEAATTGLSSSNGGFNIGVTSSNQKIALDTAFLTTLISLTKINIDTSLFTKPSFEALHDNTVSLSSVEPGRVNPFAPINDSEIQSSYQTDEAPVVTNEPTQVTDKSAVLNGAINGGASATSTYFEYGPTPSLGKTTPPSNQSLVNTFVAKITGLSSGTIYFYRADAKIDGTIVSGDIMSFNTD